ncbi:MAG: hypothetical protein VYD19_05340 [Myxococcota bacterium]|nr:hypothetical protein [Myxococcota bacterium]
MRKSDRFYTAHAVRLVAGYEGVSFQAVHGAWRPLLPAQSRASP